MPELMKKIHGTILLLIIMHAAFSQQPAADTTKTLDSITLKAFEQRRVSASASISTAALTDYSSKTSLVNGLNTISGVRMEERSPGSYRLSIRGSSLRSPFGVRNLKVYWNGIPITDPGGNTYFNQFAWNNFSDLVVVKGPVSSMYGAGTGGLVLLSSISGPWQPGFQAELITGSYQLRNVFASGQFYRYSRGEDVYEATRNIFTYAHSEADGYRDHTRLRRDNFSWVTRVKRNRYELTGSFLFTDMYYQTPGALTLAEFTANPKAARPAAGGFPGAAAAEAAIFQKNILAGLSSRFLLGIGFENTTTLYGSFNHIRNPAIRNYERRNEPSYGGRSVFKYSRRIESIGLEAVGGAEFQQGFFNTLVSKNRNGNPDTLLTNDDIGLRMLSVFVQATVNWKQDWYLSAGISSNESKIAITRLSSYPVLVQERRFRSELAPRLSLIKHLSPLFNDKMWYNWSVTVSKGFSPPTTAELLPSTGVINTSLQAEKGWNYETSLRVLLFRKKVELECTGFYFKLYDALVQRRDLTGADFFVNAGDIIQKGLEFSAAYKKQYSLFSRKQFSIRADVTLNHFRYGSFIRGTENLSGKVMPSVPSATISLTGNFQIKNGLYLNTSYYGASAIFLNDANTASARPYHLLGVQFGWRKKETGKTRLTIYAGADNILDEVYSLGNDINAAAGRYYNAAPRRNYYIGVAFRLVTPRKK